MFNKSGKISQAGISSMRSDYGNRNGGAGFTDFISVTGLDKWKPKEGPNTIDVIPYNASKMHPLVISGQADEGDTLYSLEVFVHKEVGPSKSNYVCLKQFGKRCPLCEEAKRLKNLGSPEASEQSKNLYAKRRIIYLIHDLSNNSYGYWDTGFKNVQQKITALEGFETDGNGGKANVFDWETGKTIRFMGTEKPFKGTKFIEPDGFNFASRQPLSDEVLSHSVDLSTFLKVVDEETMENILSGVEVKNTASVQQQNTYEQPQYTQQQYSRPQQQYSQPQQYTQPQTEEYVPVENIPNQNTVSAGPKCPFGYKLGETDKHEECSRCGDEWETCMRMSSAR